jgi:hypothetical protein
MESVYDYCHPDLGVVRGLASELTKRFLGVRYADLSDKFSDAKLKEGTDEEFINATAFGYVGCSSEKIPVLVLTFIGQSPRPRLME